MIIYSDATKQIKRLIVGFLENNCYLIECLLSGEMTVIDPGAEAENILANINPEKVRFILITHGYHDHIGALEELRKRTKAQTGIHPLDVRVLRNPPHLFFEDGQVLKLGHIKIRVIHTPGHSPGGVCFLIDEILFSGDTIFPNGPGNTAIPGANHEKILESIHRKIFTLPEKTIIFPGHGPETTVGREKATPFYPLPDKLRNGI